MSRLELDDNGGGAMRTACFSGGLDSDEGRLQGNEEEARGHRGFRPDGVGRKWWRLEACCSRHVLQLEEEPWRVGPGAMRRAG
jgi:hypothetical protein